MLKTHFWVNLLTISSLGFWLFLKSETFHWYLTDENIYYLLARNLGFATLPYRDFFYANPPFLLILLKISGFLFHWQVAGLRIIPIGAVLVSSWSIHRLLKRQIGLLLAIPLWIFLFSYISLRASTHATGINVTLMFIFLAYLFVREGRTTWGAVAFSLGLLTKFYSITALPALLLGVFLVGGPDRKKKILVFAGIVGVSQILLAVFGTLLGGKAFWEMNLWYHLAKPESASNDFVAVFSRLFDRNVMSFLVFLLCLAFGGGSLLALKRQGKPLRPPSEIRAWFWVGGVNFLTVLLFLAIQKRVFDFYFLLFLPSIIFLLGGILWFGTQIEWGEDLRKRFALHGGLLAISGFLLLQPILPMNWRVMMRDPQSSPVAYWDHERRNLDELVEWGKKLDFPPGTTVFGDSATTPLFVLGTDFKIALNEADTNSMRFRAGYPPPEEFIQRLEESRVNMLMVRTSLRADGKETLNGMFLIQEFGEYLKKEFQPAASLEMNDRTKVYLLARKPVNE
ncbi:MAG: DUF2029 domain-containing protein [Candidatus Omnitrophica bacterium]|nr:DUF2029 domain-containing protein [Candidatus Omnitrophota bacterium]